MNAVYLFGIFLEQLLYSTYNITFSISRKKCQGGSSCSSRHHERTEEKFQTSALYPLTRPKHLCLYTKYLTSVYAITLRLRLLTHIVFYEHRAHAFEVFHARVLSAQKICSVLLLSLRRLKLSSQSHLNQHLHQLHRKLKLSRLMLMLNKLSHPYQPQPPSLYSPYPPYTPCPYPYPSLQLY